MRPPSDATEQDLQLVLELRNSGHTYMAIERAMGRDGKRGFWAMACLRSPEPNRPDVEAAPKGDWANLSLWKKLDGGPPCGRVIRFLRENGIKARKPKGVSEFEGRYDIKVPREDLAMAEALLMHQGGQLHGLQRTDDLSCPVQR